MAMASVTVTRKSSSTTGKKEVILRCYVEMDEQKFVSIRDIRILNKCDMENRFGKAHVVVTAWRGGSRYRNFFKNVSISDSGTTHKWNTNTALVTTIHQVRGRARGAQRNKSALESD